jgi:hypothetical protein
MQVKVAKLSTGTHCTMLESTAAVLAIHGGFVLRKRNLMDAVANQVPTPRVRKFGVGLAAPPAAVLISLRYDPPGMRNSRWLVSSLTYRPPGLRYWIAAMLSDS